MEEDYLFSADPRILNQVNYILLSENIDIVKKRINAIPDTDYLKVIFVLGVNAYKQKRYDIASEVFGRFKSTNIVTGKNNLAYMMRRKELQGFKTCDREIVQLLRQGLECKDSFSIINMALFWALYVGGKENWRFADELMNFFDTSKIVQVDEWWEDLGKAEDIEGYVVHYWLLKHGYLLRSNLGSLKDIINVIKAKSLEISSDLLEGDAFFASDTFPDFW